MSAAENVISLSELANHRTSASCWVVINGHVYDVTNFLSVHPGGKGILIQNSGKDATPVFDSVNHSKDAKEQMKKYLAGRLSADDAAALVASTSSSSKQQTKALPQYTMAEVAAKRGPDESWMVLSNMVLDVTKFGGDHPGGPDIIRFHSGTDATVAFKNNGHSMTAVEMSKKLIIGELAPKDRVEYTKFETREWKVPTSQKPPSPVREFVMRQLSVVVLLVLACYLGWLRATS